MAVTGQGLNPRTMSVDQIIEKGMGAVFKFPWDYHGDKNDFQIQFLRHYYMQEIGQETVALFRMSLQDSLALIMPRYNALLDSENLTFEKISNYAFTRTSNQTETLKFIRTWEHDDIGESSAHAFNKFADTPQNVVDKIMGHLSSADESDSNNAYSSSKGERENKDNNNKQNATVNETGYNGADPNALLTSYRSTILEINRSIITDPEILKCFMGIW